MLATAEWHAELARRLTPRSQLEQVLLDRGVKDHVLLERAATADRLTRQVMADVAASQPGSQATTRAPMRPATRGLGAVQVRARAERQPGVTEVQADVMPELWPEPESAQADPAWLEEETGAHAQNAQVKVREPVRNAEFPAKVKVESSAWRPPAADISLQCGAQAEARMGEPEIEL